MEYRYGPIEAVNMGWLWEFVESSQVSQIVPGPYTCAVCIVCCAVVCRVVERSTT